MLLPLQISLLLRLLYDPIPNDALIYTSDIPFQYNEREGRHAEFIGNPSGTVFVAAKRDHELLLSLRSNTPNMSSNSINFWQLHVNGKCSNLTEIAPANTSGSLHHMYCAQKQDANTEYLGRVKMVLSIHLSSINFADPANIRKAHNL